MGKSEASWSQVGHSFQSLDSDTAVRMKFVYFLLFAAIIGGSFAQKNDFKVECRLEENVRYPGEDLKNLKTADSEDCQQLCINEHPKCVGFTFAKSENQCYLKSALGKKKGDSNYESGFCTSVWTLQTKKLYRFYELKTWEEAQQACRDFHGRLATFEYGAKIVFYRYLPDDYDLVWVGGKR